MAGLAEFAELARRFDTGLWELAPVVERLGLPAAATREWAAVLERKLLPQLGAEAFLIVAVTGGTNIGKSVVFNHLAGFRASASSPLASGTKHPVCLVPDGFPERHDLPALFPSFRLVEWSEAAQALGETPEHLLFWRTHPDVPPNLLLLDTPDIDSDALVNWERADAVRQSADVLIAVLTQQKYNDAAVKQFFRNAAAEDKAVVAVFNQCELPDDRTYVPLWLKTFTTETGVRPEAVFLAENNRKTAEAIALEFFELFGSETVQETRLGPGVKLQEVFARLKFASIKLRTVRGALAYVVDPVRGAPAFLREVRSRSGEFRAAADLLTAHELAEVEDWPVPPTNVTIAAVRAWWSARRQGWSKTVHGVYDTVGSSLWWPVSTARDWWAGGPPPDPWDAYREQEWAAIVRAVGKVYGRLEWLTELGNPLLKSRLEQLLAGTSRTALLRELETAHRAVPFPELLEATVVHELQSFQSENPQLFGLLKRLDEATAAARPALSIVLGVTGVGLPLGEAAAQFASQGLIHAAMHVVGDVAAGTAVATVGETAISSTASSTAGYLQSKFHRLQEAFTARRAAWLAEQLHTHVLGKLTLDLEANASVCQTSVFTDLVNCLHQWEQRLSEIS